MAVEAAGRPGVVAGAAEKVLVSQPGEIVSLAVCVNLISRPPCMGPFLFSQRKRGSKWVPLAHSLHYLEPGSQPQAWGETEGL